MQQSISSRQSKKKQKHVVVDCESHQQQQQLSLPQYSSINIMLFILLLFRGPLLWLFGMSFLTTSSIALWNYLVSSSLHTSMIPLFAATLFVLVTIWTIYCGTVLTRDVYDLLLYPKIVHPVIVVASKYSIDDILTTVCDPTQLASYILALFVVPISLYTLPTTPQQRAQVFLSTFLPENSNDNNRIFTEPGGWKFLLPLRMQQLVKNINTHSVDDQIRNRESADSIATFEEEAKCTVDGRTIHQDVVGIDSTDDEDESNNDDDDHIGAGTTTYQTSSGQSFSRRTTETKQPNRNHTPFHRTDTKSSPIGQTEEYSQTNDVSELFVKIIADMVDHKFHSACQRLEKYQSTIMLTTVTALTLLILQFRNSPTARSIIKSAVHIILTATSSLTLLGSLMALLTPYIRQQRRPVLQKNQHEQQSRNRTARGVPSKSDVHGWSTTLLSSIVKSYYSIRSSDIPKSIPMIRSTLQLFVFRWKGTVAVFLLTYFQYRYRKIKQAQQNKG